MITVCSKTPSMRQPKPELSGNCVNPMLESSSRWRQTDGFNLCARVNCGRQELTSVDPTSKRIEGGVVYWSCIHSAVRHSPHSCPRVQESSNNIGWLAKKNCCFQIFSGGIVRRDSRHLKKQQLSHRHFITSWSNVHDTNRLPKHVCREMKAQLEGGREKKHAQFSHDHGRKRFPRKSKLKGETREDKKETQPIHLIAKWATVRGPPYEKEELDGAFFIVERGDDLPLPLPLPPLDDIPAPIIRAATYWPVGPATGADVAAINSADIGVFWWSCL